jgi:putative drug exporter of the RND superfamily
LTRNVAAWPGGRRKKWVFLVLWLVIAMAIAGPLSGKLTGAEKNDTSTWLPSGAEATQVVALQSRFQNANVAPAVVVYQRASGITAADRAKADADAQALARVDGVTGPVAGPIASRDGQALQTAVPLAMGTAGWGKITKRMAAISQITGGDAGLTVHIAGPAAFNADSAKAFSGIDHTLLFATVLVVIVILLLAYRSPMLWLLPVLCAGFALTTAEAFIYVLAKSGAIVVNGQSAGILTVLVFGVGTDYALLLIARYREELHRHEDRHQAMAIATRRAGPAIIASAATVAVSLLCLQFAQMNSTRGLGPVAAIGVAVALVVMVTLLPALLVIFGRWVFWPKKPKFGAPVQAGTGLWARIGVRIARRPRLVWSVAVVVLAASVFGVAQLHATGLTAKNSFTNHPESVTAQQVLAEHFPAGQDGQPVVVIGNAAASTQLRQALAGTPGIASVSPPVARGGLVSLDATLRPAPDTAAATATVERVRTAVHAIAGADAKVGGQTALTLDLNNAQSHDNKLIIPIILLAMLVILGVLLRAVVAPLLLVGTVVLSFGSALGISALMFHALGFHGADSSLPLLVFVFLVALGIDYNIFLMTRVREEALQHGTRRGMLTGLATTGGVITSAGLVLAATFSVFATIPMVAFAEIGVAIAIGVLLDTFIVRSVLVSALTFDIGRRIWWPGKLASKRDTTPRLVGTGETPRQRAATTGS